LSQILSHILSQTVVPAPASHLLEWLAISLTAGLGPTKARKLVEHFGSAEAVFHASLTELESTGIQVVSAQSLATGKSAELAREEIAPGCRGRRDPGLDGGSLVPAPPERNL